MSRHTRINVFFLVLILVTVSKIGLGMELRVMITNNDFKSLSHSEVQAKANGNIIIVCYNRSLEVNAPIILKPTENGITLLIEDKEYQLSSPVWLYPPVNGKIKITSILRGGENKFNPSYRGFLEIHSDGKSLQLINQVGLEDYLYGVVPSEMPASWPLEAIKAQAIASRTYVVRAIQKAEQEGKSYHVEDSVFSQVYNNRQEASLSNLAVNLTRGLVMVDTCSGDLIKSYFHSTSGGITASAGDVWGYARHGFPNSGTAYLLAKAVSASALEFDFRSEKQVSEFLKSKDIPSYEQESPWYRWKLSLSIKELEQIINANLAEQYHLNPDFVLTKQPNGQFSSEPIPELGIGKLLDIKVVKRGLGGNILSLEIQGTTGTYQVTKELNIRNLLQPTNLHTDGSDIIIERMIDQVKNYPILPSAFCIFEINQNQAVIYGGGNGHGVGMSQWGAKGMAEAGYSYSDILKSFYTDIELVNIYKSVGIGS